MTKMTRELKELDASALADQINASGYCVVTDFLAPSMLAGLQRYVQSLVAQTGGYVSLNGRASFGQCAVTALADDPDFGEFMRRIYVAGTRRAAPALDFYQVLRCLVGPAARGHSMNFHYDSYVVTALIPLEIPKCGMTGDLIMVPNTRGIRRIYLLNALDKMLLENKASQHVLRWLIRTNRVNFIRLKLEPGNLYMFWGYRTIHANEPCDENVLRSTLLYHYANPHADSGVSRLLKLRQSPAAGDRRSRGRRPGRVDRKHPS